MWSNTLLKENAKSVLRQSFWLALVACLVANAIGMVPEGVVRIQRDLDDWGISFFPLALLAPCFMIFVVSAVDVGLARYMLLNRSGQVDLNHLFSGFRSSEYLPIVKTMLVRGIYILLWSLLLLIPGIIKMYSYRLVPYILAQNPGIGIDRALKLSDQMTYGEKMNMFILDLSFLGWVVLSLFTCGIGFVFLSPYYEATYAELYTALSTNALENGMCTPEELGFYA